MNLENLSSKKIGYTPVDPDFSTAGDRRRFIYFASQIGLKWELCDTNSDYDIVYITTIANMSDWIAYKKANPDTVLIFDINNSFYFNTDPLWNLARGVSRFLTKRESRLYLNYNNVYFEMFEVADIVVCQTESAKEFISDFNNNVFLSFDYFGNEITQKKSDYSIDLPLKVVWEGMGVTTKHILTIAPILEKFKDEICLKVITDRSYKFAGFDIDVKKILRRLKCDYEFVDWEQESFSRHISDADVAIIPLDSSDKVALHKPENKLVLFWQHGVPVITSNTPAYREAFSHVDYDLTCDDLHAWQAAFEKFLSGNFDGRKHIQSAQSYLTAFRSREQFMTTWSSIFIEALRISRSSPQRNL